jgi:hypothetical protein
LQAAAPQGRDGLYAPHATPTQPSTIALLTLPPLLWAGNAVVGRLVHGLVPPMTLNLLRWLLAFALLLPLAGGAARRQPAVGALAPLQPAGPAGRGLLQRAAVPGAADLHPDQRDPGGLEHAGVDAGVGALFFGVPVARRQLLGALLSIVGVLLVLSRGEWAQLMACAGARRSVHAAGHDRLGLLQLAAGAHPRARRPAPGLGRLSDGADGVRPGLVGPVRGRRMAADAGAHRLGLAAGGGAGLHRAGAGPAGLPLLGQGVQRAGPNVAAFSSTSRRCSRP